MIFDIENFLKDYNILSRKHGKNTHFGWTQICCPFCVPRDTGFHGGFNLTKGYYNCWKCGNHSIISLIQKLLKYSKEESKKLITKYTIPLKHTRIDSKALKHKNGTFSLPYFFSALEWQYKVYLKKRNFDPKFLEKKYDLKSSGPVGKYKFRIIAPIYYNNQMVSYQGRDITGLSKIKYMACEKKEELIHHKDILYNLDNSNSESVIVVEGITDVWRFGNDCVATFGIEWTQNQIKILKNKYKKINILYDYENIAQKKATELALNLNIFGIETNNIKLSNGDPADLTPIEALKLKEKIL